MIELKKQYQAFFKAKGGEHLISIITEIVSSNHLKAEADPNLARDYVQRAKGAREVLDHIQSVLGARDKQ